jgi:AcrR family transcriptional regulator
MNQSRTKDAAPQTADAPPASSSPAPGLRERHKQDKLERLQQAAWRLFHERGFEATTTREVAETAGIATGTLFLYAADKGELLQLAFDGALREALAAATGIPADLSIVDRIAAACSPFFRVYARDRDLARRLLKELGPGGSQTLAGGVTDRLFRLISEQIVVGQERREIGAAIDPSDAAGVCLALYQHVLAGWLGGALRPGDAPDERLRRLLGMVMAGLAVGVPVGAAGASETGARAGRVELERRQGAAASTARVEPSEDRAPEPETPWLRRSEPMVDFID